MKGKEVERNVPICQVLPPNPPPPPPHPPSTSPPTPPQMMLAADNSQMVRRQQLEGGVGGRGGGGVQDVGVSEERWEGRRCERDQLKRTGQGVRHVGGPSSPVF